MWQGNNDFVSADDFAGTNNGNFGVILHSLRGNVAFAIGLADSRRISLETIEEKDCLRD